MTNSPQELVLGIRVSGDGITLASDERRRHLYIVGQTGAGKSTLLLNLDRAGPGGRGRFGIA